MKYLLDINALLALGFLEHAFHERVARWVRTQSSRGTMELITCSIVELGFVRVLAQAPQYGITVKEAKNLLLQLKQSDAPKISFLADDHGVAHLPSWATTAGRTTDGHLAELARSHGAVLATLDERIPGAFLIPV